MKNIKIKITALLLGLAVALTSVYYVNAAESTILPKKNGTEKETEANSDSEPFKNETVYILASADGSVQKIIVSDYIKNCLNADSLSDKSVLKNIKNIKGDEEYKTDGDNSLVWDANGNDIYYRGEIEKELPVSLSVSYSLDDEAISPDKLAGKSGKVKISFDYKNNQYKTVNIDGKQEKIYVPFVMLTGLILDNETFKNVKISNGKLIDDGDKNICIGYAMPGLQQNLAIGKDVMAIPEGFSITADVKKFKMGMTVTLATSGMFNDIDTSKLDTANIDDSVKQLSDGINSLADGTSALYAGITTLSLESGKLVNGMNELAKGVGAIKDGAKSAYEGALNVDNGVGQISDNVGKLDDGAGALSHGCQQLYNGLDELTQNNDTLNQGAGQVFSGLIKNIVDSFAQAGVTIEGMTSENYETKLNALLNSPTDAQKAQLINIASSSIDAKLGSNGVPSQYFGACKYLMAAGKSEQEIIAALNNDPQLITSAAQTAQTQQGQNAIELLCLNAAKSSLSPKVSQAIESLNGYKTFAAGIKAYTDGVSAVKTGASALNENLGALKVGTAALKDGVLQLKDGTVLLKGGLYQLSNGAETLFDGVLTIKNGMPKLTDGIGKLKDGVKSLNDGITKFKNEGIGKLLSLYNGDLKGLIARVKATVDVSKSYKSFSGIDELSDGSVKFIYRTAEIK